MAKHLKTHLLIDSIIKEFSVNYTYDKMKQIKVPVHQIMPIF
jgi:hypothetical protein